MPLLYILQSQLHSVKHRVDEDDSFKAFESEWIGNSLSVILSQAHDQITFKQIVSL